MAVDTRNDRASVVSTPFHVLYPEPDGSLAALTDRRHVAGLYAFASAANVTPGTGAIQFTGYAPTVTTSADVDVTPGTGVLQFTGYAPTVVVPGVPPAQPTITAALVGTTLTLTSSAFSHPQGDGHAASQWQVQQSGGDWSDPVYDSGADTENLTSIEIDVSDWDSGVYEARVRHMDDDYPA